MDPQSVHRSRDVLGRFAEDATSFSECQSIEDLIERAEGSWRSLVNSAEGSVRVELISIPHAPNLEVAVAWIAVEESPIPFGSPAGSPSGLIVRPGNGYRLDLRGAEAMSPDDPAIALFISLLGAHIERILSQQSLQRAEEDRLFRFESNPHVPWTADTDGNITDFNQRWLDLTGLLRSEALNDGWQRAVFPDDVPSVQRAWTRSLATGDPFDIEHRLRTTTGVIWSRSRAVPRRNEQGQILNWYGTTEDINDRKTAELDARQRERELQSLVDAMPHIAWIADSDGRNTYLNARWAAYVNGSQVRDDRIGDFVHPDDLAASNEQWEQSIADSSDFSCAMRLADRNGNYRWHLTQAVPVRDGEGKVVRWIGTSTDIHELRQKEEEVRRLNEELEKRVSERTEELLAANRELEAITYSVAHDLRAPLRTIVATADILLDEAADYLNFDQVTLLQRQSRSARLLSSLIDELLSFARLARTKVFRTDIDLSRIATEVVEDLAADRQIHHMRMEIQPEMRASADGRLVQLILLNLIDNAMKFSPDGGRIVIGQRESDRAFYVQDEGIGFDIAHSEKIFLPFERLNPNGEFGGTGIGLANVQRMVSLHGGKVWAESKPSSGSTFFFTLEN